MNQSFARCKYYHNVDNCCTKNSIHQSIHSKQELNNLANVDDKTLELSSIVLFQYYSKIAQVSICLKWYRQIDGQARLMQQGFLKSVLSFIKILISIQKQPSSRGVLYRDVLRNFVKFTGKHLWQSLIGMPMNFLRHFSFYYLNSREVLEIVQQKII